MRCAPWLDCCGAHVCLTMGSRITRLKIQKRNTQRVNVYLDGRFAFGLSIVEAARLQVGQVLSDEEIAQLRKHDEVERAVSRGMDLLSYRPRSRAEVRRRLRKKGHMEPSIEEATHRLTRAGLLDDQEFANYWVENRFQFNPRGRVILRMELRQKGVGDDVIASVLEDYDEEDAAARAAEAGIRRLRHHETAVFRRKLTDYLRRRGFPYGIVKSIVEAALAAHALEEHSDRREE
jgi:regulatory protein